MPLCENCDSFDHWTAKCPEPIKSKPKRKETVKLGDYPASAHDTVCKSEPETHLINGVEPCPVCERRRMKQRELMRKRRAAE